MGKITLDKIAVNMGVSKVAVFKALNNKKGVSEELRQKIKNYAKELGYINKSSLIEAKNKKFLFFINKDFFLTPSEQFYSTIFYFLCSECTKAGGNLQIAFLEPDSTVNMMSDLVMSYKPDGIFVAGEINKILYDYLESIKISTVYIDYSPSNNCNAVYVDNYRLSYSLTKYLINKGHKDIGFVGDIHKTSSIADRYFGYIKALTEENLKIDNQWHINNNLVKNDDITNLSFDKFPTAFICHCDAAAQRMYTALALKGLKVPDDISIISFDNTSLCESLIPNLTSAGPLKDYYAKKAFTTIIECLNNKNKNYQVLIKTNLVERNSVKDINIKTN